jgi:hypothetical protein
MPQVLVNVKLGRAFDLKSAAGRDGRRGRRREGTGGPRPRAAASVGYRPVVRVMVEGEDRERVTSWRVDCRRHARIAAWPAA